MPRNIETAASLQSRTPLIIEVEGYDGDGGSIVVSNYRAGSGAGFGAEDRIYCIGEMGADGVIRFNDWGYATADEAREALQHPAKRSDSAVGNQ